MLWSELSAWRSSHLYREDRHVSEIDAFSIDQADMRACCPRDHDSIAGEGFIKRGDIDDEWFHNVNFEVDSREGQTLTMKLKKCPKDSAKFAPNARSRRRSFRGSVPGLQSSLTL